MNLIRPSRNCVSNFQRLLRVLAKAPRAQWFADATNGITDFFAKVGHFVDLHAQEYCAQHSDGTETCVTGDQLKSLLAAPTAASAPNAGGASGAPAASPEGETNEPPVITINGDNPATISTGATYSDLGATITGPQADLNLGIHLYVDGTATDAVQLDTSIPGHHTINYAVTGHSGLISTTTRTGTDSTSTAQ